MDNNLIIYSSIGLLIFSSIYIGGAVAGGIFTALISALGVGLVLIKTKDRFPKVWRFIVVHPIMSDIFFSGLLAFLLINNTVTGIISAAGAGLFVSAGLSIATKLSVQTPS